MKQQNPPNKKEGEAEVSDTLRDLAKIVVEMYLELSPEERKQRAKAQRMRRRVKKE